MTIIEYTQELKAKLAEKISTEFTEEAVEETRGHLHDRAEELRATGISQAEAEMSAVQEFGSVEEITRGFVASYPPKPPFNPAHLQWLVGLFVVFWVSMAFFVFFSSTPRQGLESVASMLVSNSPMLVVPGFFAGLSRLKYRRFRAAKGVVMMSNIGLGMALAGGGILIGYRLLGISSSPQLFPMYTVMLVVSCVGYALTRNLQASGWTFTHLRRLK